jgi:hypothetical protein
MRELVLAAAALLALMPKVLAADPVWSPDSVAAYISRTGMPPDWFKCNTAKDCTVAFNSRCQPITVNLMHVADVHSWSCRDKTDCVSTSCPPIIANIAAYCVFGYCVEYAKNHK